MAFPNARKFTLDIFENSNRDSVSGRPCHSACIKVTAERGASGRARYTFIAARPHHHGLGADTRPLALFSLPTPPRYLVVAPSAACSLRSAWLRRSARAARSRDIESSPGFPTMAVVGVSRLWIWAVSVGVSPTGTVGFPRLEFCFLRRHREDDLAFRAARASSWASSMVLTRRHSSVEFALPTCLIRQPKVVGAARNSELPAWPRSVISMNPSVSHSRIAGAMESRSMPKWTKSS